jgi:hypothetical protein
MATLNFDAGSVQPMEPMAPIPNGRYTAVITESQVNPTSAGTGHFLKLRFVLTDGEHAGRAVYERLNIQNPNPVAQEIAERTLASICKALGIQHLRESEELHNIPLDIDVSTRPASTGKDGREYGPSNEIRGYYASAQAQEAASPARTENAGASRPPWVK